MKKQNTVFTLYSLCPLPVRRSLDEGGCSLWLKIPQSKMDDYAKQTQFPKSQK